MLVILSLNEPPLRIPRSPSSSSSLSFSLSLSLSLLLFLRSSLSLPLPLAAFGPLSLFPFLSFFFSSCDPLSLPLSALLSLFSFSVPTHRRLLSCPSTHFFLCTMESLCLQGASLYHPNFGKLPSPISPQPFKNGFSLSLKTNLSRPILHAKKHEKVTLGEAPSSRPAKVCCCSIAHHSTNGSLTPAVSGSVTDKSLVEAVEKVQDEQALLLQKRASELGTDLRGTCIYLIGMMGSGKTTVGKLLAEALGYHFFDSDKLIEEAAGGITVAQFFKQQDEESFRNAETEVLKQLSCNGRLVVATGGGIVVRSVNWSYLRHGVTAWLDVPVEALAERVVAVGTHSRPLLGESNEDSAHSQALARLSSIFESRAPFYADADVIVSLRKLASRLGYQHVRDLTPTIIAIEVLEEINKLIVRKKHKDAASAV